jgi:hypothetical protein
MRTARRARESGARTTMEAYYSAGVSIDRMWATLCHQGSVTAESAAAVPGLIARAAKPTSKNRHLLLELLAGIAIGDQANFLDGSLSPARRKKGRSARRTVEQECYEAVVERAPALRQLLGDRDAKVRGAAAFVLAWLNDGESTAALARQLKREPDADARVSMIIALGHLGVRPAKVESVAEAIAAVYVDGKKARVRDLLEDAASSRSLRKTGQPWNGGDLAGHAAAVLALLPVRATMPLDGLGYMAGDKLGGQLVRKQFKGRDPKRASKLTEPQRTLLTSILRGGFTRPMGEIEHALKLRGLPPLRDLPSFIGVEPTTHPELRARRR